MNNTLHTPGHWNLTFGEYDAAIHSDVTIASINDDALAWKENARLISAAPDLLSALDLLLNKINAHGLENKHMIATIEKAELAIAKAKGVI
jgi:hypothetical protein